LAEVEHKDLTGADLHEPKGVAAAAAGTVYKSLGTGSGAWTDITSPLKAGNRIALTVTLDNISTASSVFVVCPMAGVISQVYVVLYGPITVADAVVTAEIAGAAMSGLSITAAYSGSAAGSVFSGTPSGSNTVTAGQAVEIVTDGASTTTASATITLLVNTA